MKKLFKHISSQPKSRIDSYAFLVAGTFTGVVALIWAFSLPEKMDTISGAKEADSPAPFSNLIKETGEQLAAVKDGLRSKKDDEVKEDTASSTSIVLSEEEIVKAKEALSSNSTNTQEVSTTTMPVPVLIGTTTATTTYSASSTP